MRFLLIPTAMLLAVHALPAHADECDDAMDQTTMTMCAGKAFDAADRQLNADYQAILRRLADDADARKLLTAAQKDWIAFRDSECTFQASGTAGGSVHPMIVANCRAYLTNQRVRDFKTYLACEEGDLSCPLPPK